MITRDAQSAIDVQRDGSHITITVRAAAQAGDELVPVTKESLDALGLEYAPILALAQAGTLRTVWIGRRRFTRRSWLVTLADDLPPATSSDPDDAIAIAVRKRVAKRVG